MACYRICCSLACYLSVASGYETYFKKQQKSKSIRPAMQEVERWHDFRSRSKIKCGRMQCAGRMKCMGVSHFPCLRHGSAAIIRRRRQNMCQSKQNKREKMQQQDEKRTSGTAAAMESGRASFQIGWRFCIDSGVNGHAV